MAFHRFIDPEYRVGCVPTPTESMTSKEATCIFCQITAGEAEATVVYQDEQVTAFMDLYPVTEGHVLVIPNTHAVLITEVPPEVVGKIFKVGADLDRALREADFRCEAVSLYLADGPAAGQAVFHTHLHVIPRYRGDTCGLHLHAGPVSVAQREQLDQHASTLRATLRVDKPG
jgi:diadenosine tetraphosphate (Ap4A) HIT family hydrolase